MELLFVSVFFIVLFVVAFLLSSKTTRGRIADYVKSQFNKTGRWAENQDPIAQMQLKADEAKEQFRKAKVALIKCESLKSNLTRLNNDDTKEENRLLARIKQAMHEGKTDDDPVLIELANQLNNIRKRKTDLGQQLSAQTSLYGQLLNSMKMYAQNIETLERDASSLGVRLEVSEAQAEIAEMCDQFNVGAIDTTLGEAAKFREIAERKIAENTAKLHVDQDLGANSSAKRWEAETDAKNLLSEIRSQSV
jgi:phage shock protein A